MPKILENVKESILLEGKKQLLEQGYKNLNIRSITSNCNIATGTFYNYFKNKNILVTTIFESDWNKILKSINNVSNQDASFKDKVFNIYCYMDQFVCTYIGIFIEMSSTNKKCNRKSDVLKPVFSILEEIIIKHRELGEITNPLPADKLSNFIMNNLINLSTDKYLTFDELYRCLNM